MMGIGILESAYLQVEHPRPGGLFKIPCLKLQSIQRRRKKISERTQEKLRDRKIENGNFSDHIKVLYNIKSIVFENGRCFKINIYTG